MRWTGNTLALLGALVGVAAAYLWWVASTIPADFNVDSTRDDLIAIGRANMQAAGVTAISAILIAAGEIVRAVFGHRH